MDSRLNTQNLFHIEANGNAIAGDHVEYSFLIVAKASNQQLDKEFFVTVRYSFINELRKTAKLHHGPGVTRY